VGGTACLWNTTIDNNAGAKYVPLDPIDLVRRDALPESGWPFDYSHLEPFYRRAQVVCGLGPFAYDGKTWSDDERPCFTLSSDNLTSKVYQFGLGSLFTRSHPKEVLSSVNVALCHHATLAALKTEGRKVVAADSKTPAGSQFSVRARFFVLAAGAIENARILLLSAGNASQGLGNEYGLVGRHFMEHMRDYALTLIPRSPELFEEAAFYDLHVAKDRTIVGGRIALTERALLTGELPNASITLLPRRKADRAPAGMGGRLYGRLRRWVGTEPNTGYGWSSTRKPSRAYDAFQLLVNFEQRAHPENRVMLARTRDFFGLPQAELHWNWRTEEQWILERLRRFLAAEIESAGLGAVQAREDLLPDPNAHHHAGTTRMHEDVRCGVVTPDARVHGTDNLYVTGSSILVSAGFANPTLTIVALALRLADHINQRL
jgi:choline dehydrogenase-like flavoprotein